MLLRPSANPGGVGSAGLRPSGAPPGFGGGGGGPPGFGRGNANGLGGGNALALPGQGPAGSNRGPSQFAPVDRSHLAAGGGGF